MGWKERRRRWGDLCKALGERMDVLESRGTDLFRRLGKFESVRDLVKRVEELESTLENHTHIVSIPRVSSGEPSFAHNLRERRAQGQLEQSPESEERVYCGNCGSENVESNPAKWVCLGCGHIGETLEKFREFGGEK